jgi:D-threo-aldose 1-dehydrogenase
MINKVCSQHNVPLPAAALQFALRHPAVASLVTGFGSPAEVEQCVKWWEHPVPEQLWQQLGEEKLIHPQMAAPAEC